MTTDKDYKRELERFFGYELDFIGFRRKYVELCCIKNNETHPVFIHNWFLISVLKTSESKYKDAFDQLNGEYPRCSYTSGIKFKTNQPLPDSYEKLCIINDLMGN